MRAIVTLAALALLALGAACSSGGSSGEAGPTEIVVLREISGDPGEAIAFDQVVQLLTEVATVPVRTAASTEIGDTAPGTWILALGAGPVASAVLGADKLAALPSDGYAIALDEIEARPVLAAAGADPRGTQYALYAAAETLGFRFLHPEQSHAPDRLRLPEPFHRSAAPDYRVRGFHIHSMHPIELMDSFLLESDEHLAEAKRYIDWLVANRQTYLQWVLQDTVDTEAFLRHAARIVEYAHLRGLEVGIDTPFRFIQQNAYILIPDPQAPFEPQIDASIARLMQVPWDVIHVELGSAEFFPADDVATLAWLDYTADLLDREYGVELTTKVHITAGQTAPNFGDINFNFLPGIADPRVGVLPHTVQFFDLYRPAPTYEQEDFSAMREFLLGEIGERQVLYYPETTYWVTFDVDVPLYLPQYAYSRWFDLNQLVDSGLDGQVNFTSGFEWGYWLGDVIAASSAFDAREHWTDKLAHVTAIFGKRANAMSELLEEVILEQGVDFLERNLIAELIGWDTADDIGHIFVDEHFQPERILPDEIRRMSLSQLAAYETTVIGSLEQLERSYADYVRRIKDLEDDIPASAAPWFREIRDGLQITWLRIRHRIELSRGMVASSRAALGMLEDREQLSLEHFHAAQKIRREGEQVVAAREQDYRWPVERIARPRENPTSYEFGYLYTTSDLYYWRRDEIRAFEPDFCICEGNLVNLVDTLVGEGGIGELVELLPVGGCLEQCVRPVERIRELTLP